MGGIYVLLVVVVLVSAVYIIIDCWGDVYDDYVGKDGE